MSRRRRLDTNLGGVGGGGRFVFPYHFLGFRDKGMYVYVVHVCVCVSTRVYIRLCIYVSVVSSVN